MPRHTQQGFSLIELMIAMTLGLLLTEGLFELFATTGRVNATQAALARLQENGRIAMQVIAEDLRAAGSLPCGSRVSPQVYADALSSHITAASAQANAAVGAPLGNPYALDRGIFIEGSTCTANACSPALAAGAGVPRAGLGAGDKVPGTDVLTVRSVQGEGVAADPATQVCTLDRTLRAITPRSADAALLDGFKAGHLALLAGCAQAQVFPVALAGGSLQPVSGKFGAPVCSPDAQTRLYDLDAQVQTATYYVQLVPDETKTGRTIATLMRRVNGTVNEVVQGVERLNLRYSLTDALGNAHWLSADQITRGVGANGAALQCAASGAMRPCGFADVAAVEVALLVNTVDDLPADASANAWQYRYSIDGDDLRAPPATMPSTGLPSGRMLRREFRTVIALRNLAA
jgi:type IV pilus assembly protein PilW